MNNLIKYSLSILSFSILKIIGWSDINPNYLKLLHQHQRLICVFSHSSYYDFIIMLLYYFSYPNDLNHLKTLIRGDYFNYFGFLFRMVGGIPSKNKCNGNVQRIIQELNEFQKFHFLISPKGTILRKEWHSGYYYISQELKTNLIAVGLDYETKNIKIGQILSYHNKEQDLKTKLYQDLSEIVPLYPKQENMKIRIYNKDNLYVVHPLLKKILLFFIFINIYLF